MLNRYTSLFWLNIFILVNLYGCVFVPQNKLDLYQRSMVIHSGKDIKRILDQSKLIKSNDPAVNDIKIIVLKGTPYEMGFQHGRLLGEEVRENIRHVVKLAMFYADEDMMDEAFDLMAPYIPMEYMEEMRGLAHGADLPLKVVHWFHCIPEVSEYGPKKKFSRYFKATSCSNIVATGQATQDGELYQLRVLDWIRDMGVQAYPVILVHQPETGNASVTFSYAGFIGCVSGMNDQKMAFGEMGYGDPEGESLEGIPFIFLFRKLLKEAQTLEDATRMIKDARRTCSYVYMISDAKMKAPDNALLYITNRQQVEMYPANKRLVDKIYGKTYPPIENVVYGGPKEKELNDALQAFNGRLSPETLIEIAKPISLLGNMQNVIFKPRTMEAWVSNAANAGNDEEGKACYQKWFYYNYQPLLSK